MPTRGIPDFVESLGNGVFSIDTDFQRPLFDAAYLVVDQGEVAFIDTGTGLAVPRLLAALQALDLEPEQVRWIIPTHVHLDHAGGVGPLLAHTPNAQVLVHPRGARHLIDPSALFKSATAVYGADEMALSYGDLVAVPADRVIGSHDGQTVSLGSRQLLLIDTPGHALHHHCIWDPVSQGWFTGDSFGLCYRELNVGSRPWALPTTTPVQFDPTTLRQTYQRLLAFQPQCVYLTHFGKRSEVAALGQSLLRLLDDVEALGLRLRQAPERHKALREGLTQLYLDSLKEAGSPLDAPEIMRILALDVELNAQGMACWLDRIAR